MLVHSPNEFQVRQDVHPGFKYVRKTIEIIKRSELDHQ